MMTFSKPSYDELYLFDKCFLLSEKSQQALDKNFILKKRRISPRTILRGGHFLIDLYWLVITRGRTWVYSVFEAGKEIHHSYCNSAFFKFPFMSEGDFHIGRCKTIPSHRGQGIYPRVISIIAKDCLKQNPYADIYMIVKNDNTASLRGIQKAGFNRVGRLSVARSFVIFKIYRLATT